MSVCMFMYCLNTDIHTYVHTYIHMTAGRLLWLDSNRLLRPVLAQIAGEKGSEEQAP